MLDDTMLRIVIEYFVERNGIYIIKNKSNIFVIIWIFISGGNEADVFGGASVKGPGITLMREIDFIIVVIFQNKTHIFAKKEFVLDTISIGDNKNTFGYFYNFYFVFHCFVFHYFVFHCFVFHYFVFHYFAFRCFAFRCFAFRCFARHL